MRIGLGLNLLAPDNGGATNYALSLLRHWTEHAPEHTLIPLTFAHNEPLLATLPPAARRHEIRLRTQEEAIDHRQAFDVYACPFGTLWPRPLHQPSVVTFHDMQERFYPEFFTEKERRERFFHYDWSLRMADAVVAISSFTRDTVVQLAGVPARNCHVVPHVPDELPPPQPPAAWPETIGTAPFLFYPANFWRHKNHHALLQALGVARRHGLDVHLVCTGSLLGREDAWNAAVRAAGVEGRAHHLHKVSRPEITWLYRHARGLFFPSLFEGFGIPFLEAMQTDCPIACGLNTSQTEVAAAAALYFDAARPESMAGAMARLVSDESLRQRLVQAGQRRLADFSPARFIRGHVDAFAAACRRHHRGRAWYNDRIRLPRSLEDRTELTAAEKKRAPRLLAARARLPAGAEHAVPLA